MRIGFVRGERDDNEVDGIWELGVGG